MRGARRMRGTGRSAGSLALAAVLALGVCGCSATPGGARATAGSGSASSASATPSPALPAGTADGAAAIRALFEKQRSGIEVHATGTVVRVLADDTEGSPHQRFILRLTDGLTVLVAHNTDLAPRLDGLAVGDAVEFLGEYEWSGQGGTVHWTHHDPQGGHADGWLRWNGRTYS